MKPENLHSKMVESINEILDSIATDQKNITLAKQRGYLTGWLARLASQDWMIRQEIEAKLNLVRNKKEFGAGSEDRTRN